MQNLAPLPFTMVQVLLLEYLNTYFLQGEKTCMNTGHPWKMALVFSNIPGQFCSIDQALGEHREDVKIN